MNSNTQSNKGGLFTLLVVAVIVILFLGYNLLNDNDMGFISSKEDAPLEAITELNTEGNIAENVSLKATQLDIVPHYKTTYSNTKIIRLKFIAENNSNEIIFIGGSKFSTYIDDVYVDNEDINVFKDGTAELGMDLAPGKKAEGYLWVEVAADSNPKILEVHHERWNSQHPLTFKFEIPPLDSAVTNESTEEPQTEIENQDNTAPAEPFDNIITDGADVSDSVQGSITTDDGTVIEGTVNSDGTIENGSITLPNGTVITMP